MRGLSLNRTYVKYAVFTRQLRVKVLRHRHEVCEEVWRGRNGNSCNPCSPCDIVIHVSRFTPSNTVDTVRLSIICPATLFLSRHQRACLPPQAAFDSLFSRHACPTFRNSASTWQCTHTLLRQNFTRLASSASTHP